MSTSGDETKSQKVWDDAVRQSNKRSSWIAVADRLPTTPIIIPELNMLGGETLGLQHHSHPVLVWLRTGRIAIDTLIRPADNSFSIFYIHELSVTHWQPLPEPPLK